MLKCNLQINLAPNDYPHAKFMLTEQIDAFIGQVGEVVLVLDTHRSRGRFGLNWDENLAKIKTLIESQCARDKKIRLAEVDYSHDTFKRVANFFFGSDFIPKKDYRGGPFYSYFYGLYIARSTFVLHLDSDIFIGGGSQEWVEEAIGLFSGNMNLFTCSPLPGPPHPAIKLIGQPAAVHFNDGYTFKFSEMSTRVFMVDLGFFEKQKLTLDRPGVKNTMKAWIRKHPPYQLPEVILSAYMQSGHLERIDFLGSGEGMWSLHPPYRNAFFYQTLPDLIKMVNKNDLPSSQNGFYDIVDEVCDWSDAREKLRRNRWWKKPF